MKLTGKCKEDFDEWYLIWILNNKPYWSLHFSSEKILENWKSLHNSEKYGVLVDFFLSVGMLIELNSVMHHKKGLVFVILLTDLDTSFIDNYDLDYKPLTEARIKAIEKANELYNKK